MADSTSHVSTATAATFVQEVLERSKQVPVLVDFWAEWCAPCKMLGPLLERAVEERGGAVWLAKVDTDTNQQLAAQFGIRGIPAVKAFVDGQVVDEFVGMRHRRDIDAFIDGVVPAPEQAALRQAEQMLAAGAADQVPRVLEPALASPRTRDEASLLEARARFAENEVEQATAALDRIEASSPVAEQATALRAQGELMGAADGADAGSLADAVEQRPEDLDARWALAGALVRDGRQGDALEQLLELLQRDRAYRDDGARRAMLSIFDALGPNHALSREYRRKLQIYL